MKNIKQIFLDDIVSLGKNFFALVIAIGICFLPALYAWFNIYSNWDPYGNTGALKMAVYSEDKGFTTDEGEYKNQGDTIIEQLHDNTSVDWQFVDSREDAVERVNSGEYYGAIVIDENFTYSMYNVFSDEAEEPTLIFYQNQKKNPVANKISDTVVSTLQNNINEAFVEVVVSEVFSGASDLYDELQEQGGSEGILDRLRNLNDKMSTYESTISAVIASDEILIKNLELAQEDSTYLQKQASVSANAVTGANKSVATSQVTLSSYSAHLTQNLNLIESNIADMKATLEEAKLSEDYGQMVSALNSCLADFSTLGGNVAALEAAVNYKKLEGAALDAAQDAYILKYAEDQWPTSDQFNDAYKSYMFQADGSPHAREDADWRRSQAYQDAYNTYVEDYKTNNPDSKTVPTPGKWMLDASGNYQTEHDKYMYTSTHQPQPRDEEDWNRCADKTTAHATYVALYADKDSAEYKAALNKWETDPDGKAKAESTAAAIDMSSPEKQQEINMLISGITSNIESTLNDNSQKALEASNEAIMEAIDSVYEQTVNLEQSINTRLVPKVHEAIDALEDILTNSTTMLNSMSDTFGSTTTMFAALGASLEAADTSLEKTNEALDYINKKLATAIEKAEEVDTEKQMQIVVDTLAGDPDAYGEFFSEPVQIVTEPVYPIENYGSAVAPFYTTLAIWVGALILTAIIKVHPDKKKYKDATNAELYFGRYVLYWVLGQLQALVIVVGDINLLGIQCVEPKWFFFVASCTATTFTLFIYSLVVTWGDVGKALSVVIVVLQIAGSSGTYPIELLPEFFQKVYIFFPFPYAINAMRECTCGRFENDIWIYLLELSLFIIVSLVIGLLLKIPFEEINHYMEERMEETEMM